MAKYRILNVKLEDVAFLAKVRDEDADKVKAWLDGLGVAHSETSAIAPKAPHTKHLNGISAARISKGWTQQELADALGVIQQQVQRWESGKFRIKTAVLMRIGEALDVDWTTLVEDESQK